MKKQPVSALLQYFRLLGLALLVMVLFRLAFWVLAASDMPAPLGRDAFKAFYIGFRFDARIAALFTLPLGILLSVRPLAQRLHSWARPLTALYTLLFFGLISAYAFDFGFYLYLKSRISSLAFELLADTREAVEMVWQSYPVLTIVLAILAGTALCGYCFWRIINRPVQVRPGKLSRALGFLCGFVVFALAVYGQLNSSLFPLRWSYAYFTTNDAIIALALNPVQNMYDTLGADGGGSYDLEKVRQAYPDMVRFLGVDKPDPEQLYYGRTVPADPSRWINGVRPPNVVIIIMESLSYTKTSFAPGQSNPTPRLKELAEESLLFHRFFANTRTTARAVFTTMTGIPDLGESSTSSRNPYTVDQRVLADQFDGYGKYYLIGGNTSWANIRAVLAQNIRGLHILEEGDWKTPRADVWGVSDYDLFVEAHDLFNSMDPDIPFLAVIQTASYHAPYTVPADTPGFAHETLDKDQMANYGFESEREYNSMRYADHSLGHFMDLARKSPYYDNTIFLIFGDHGLNDKGGNRTPGYIEARLEPWHTPLIIHASPALNLVEPGVSFMPASQVDIFPTAAGLAGIGHTNWTMGRNLFDSRFDDSRVAFIGGKRMDTPIRLVEGDYSYFDDNHGKEQLFRIDQGPGEDLAKAEPERFERLRRLARSIDETARYMLFNNNKVIDRNIP